MTGDNDNELNPEEGYSSENNRESGKSKHRKAAHPLMRQAREVCGITNALVDSIEEEKERRMYDLTLRDSSMIIVSKLSGVMNSDSWLLCMQNAAIIRHHAEYLLTATYGLHMLKSVDKQYVMLLRNEMQLFRELFIDWCATIREMNKDDYSDEWGLFLRD